VRSKNELQFEGLSDAGAGALTKLRSYRQVMIVTSFVLRTISIYCDRGFAEISFEVLAVAYMHIHAPVQYVHPLAHPCTPLHTLAHPCTPLHTLAHPCTPLHTLTMQARKELYSTVQYILSFASCFAVLLSRPSNLPPRLPASLRPSLPPSPPPHALTVPMARPQVLHLLEAMSQSEDISVLIIMIDRMVDDLSVFVKLGLIIILGK
jgi:hypothetical protein